MISAAEPSQRACISECGTGGWPRPPICSCSNGGSIYAGGRRCVHHARARCDDGWMSPTTSERVSSGSVRRPRGLSGNTAGGGVVTWLASSERQRDGSRPGLLRSPPPSFVLSYASHARRPSAADLGRLRGLHAPDREPSRQRKDPDWLRSFRASSRATVFTVRRYA